MSRHRPHGRGRHFAVPSRPRPQGFSQMGLDEFHKVLLPGFQGPGKREYYNGIARGMAGLAGILGLVLGTSLLGPIGGFFGLGLGLMLASKTAVQGRYYRHGKR